MNFRSYGSSLWNCYHFYLVKFINITYVLQFLLTCVTACLVLEVGPSYWVWCLGYVTCGWNLWSVYEEDFSLHNASSTLMCKNSDLLFLANRISLIYLWIICFFFTCLSSLYYSLLYSLLIILKSYRILVIVLFALLLTLLHRGLYIR